MDIGTLGELEVINLLGKKFPVWIPFKDKGLDFGLKTDKKFYRLQIKTSKFQKGKYFWFDLYGSKMVYSSDVIYVFVCWIPERHRLMGKKLNYIVIPSKKLEKWIKEGKIAHGQKNNNLFNIFVYPNEKEKKWLYKNKGKSLDLSEYWNNFQIFK